VSGLLPCSSASSSGIGRTPSPRFCALRLRWRRLDPPHHPHGDSKEMLAVLPAHVLDIEQP
jgi:hypothetical protein